MVDVLERPAYEYGLWFVFMAIFVAAGLGAAERLAGRIRPGRVALIGSTCVLFGSLASAYLLRSTSIPLSPPVLFLPAMLAGFGIGLALPPTNAGVMDVVPELAGTASGLLGFGQFVTAGVFAQLVVQDEPHTHLILARLVLIGGLTSFCFALLSAGWGRARIP